MATQSKMGQVQDLLIGMMADLSDPKTDNTEEIQSMVKRAKAMSDIGKTLIQSANVEIKYATQLQQLPGPGMINSNTKLIQ